MHGWVDGEVNERMSKFSTHYAKDLMGGVRLYDSLCSCRISH